MGIPWLVKPGWRAWTPSWPVEGLSEEGLAPVGSSREGPSSCESMFTVSPTTIGVFDDIGSIPSLALGCTEIPVARCGPPRCGPGDGECARGGKEGALNSCKGGHTTVSSKLGLGLARSVFADRGPRVQRHRDLPVRTVSGACTASSPGPCSSSGVPGRSRGGSHRNGDCLCLPFCRRGSAKPLR